MLGTLVIVFREVIEAGLIVGIVLAATRGVAGRGLWVGLGIVGGLLGAGLLALFAGRIADAFAGTGQELLDAAVLLVAVAMLVWHNVWMAAHGRELAAEMRAVGAAVRDGTRSLTALALVVGIAVLREGSEVVLFLYGIVAAGTGAGALLLGGLLGVLAGVLVSALAYRGLVAIPMRHLFGITKWLIALLAAGLAAQAVTFLDNADVLTALDRPVWNTSWLLSEGSIPGKVLKTLVGYTDRPTMMQLLVYAATILVMVLLTRAVSAQGPARAPRSTA